MVKQPPRDVVPDAKPVPYVRSGEAAANMAQVLVIASSPVNRIVISRILERACRKPIPATHQNAESVLAENRPGMVIIDSGGDKDDHMSLLAALERLRRASPGELPRVIMIGAAADGQGQAGVVDAFVAKPFTPDMLQPVVDRLIDSASRSA